LTAKKLLDQALTSEGPYKSVVLSNEDFLLPSISEQLGFLFDGYRKNFNFKIVIYLRPLIEHVVSSWAQVLSTGSPQSGYYVESLENFIKDNDFHENILNYIKPYENYFGKQNIILKPIEKKQFFHGECIKDLLVTLGVEDFSEFKFLEKRENESPDRASLEKLIHFNRFLNSIDGDWLCAVQTKHEMITAKRDIAGIKTVYCLSPQLLLELKEKYSKAESEIASYYFERENLFLDDSPTNYEQNKCTYSGLSVEDALDFQIWIHIFCHRSLKSQLALTSQIASSLRISTEHLNGVAFYQSKALKSSLRASFLETRRALKKAFMEMVSPLISQRTFEKNKSVF
jgi:hypothetical protein